MYLFSTYLHEYIVTKRLKLELRGFHYKVAHFVIFLDDKFYDEIQ